MLLARRATAIKPNTLNFYPNITIIVTSNKLFKRNSAFYYMLEQR
jgi:hypothetical protein